MERFSVFHPGKLCQSVQVLTFSEFDSCIDLIGLCEKHQTPYVAGYQIHKVDAGTLVPVNPFSEESVFLTFFLVSLSTSYKFSSSS